MAGNVLLGLRRLAVYERHREAIRTEHLGDRLIVHGTVIGHRRPKARYPLVGEDRGAQLLQHSVSTSQGVRRAIIHRLDGERRDADRPQLAEGVESIRRRLGFVRVVGLWDEERVVWPRVARGQVHEIREVDVGCQEIERGRARFPHFEQVR